MVLCKFCDNLREYIISLDFKKVCACFFVNLRILSSFFLFSPLENIAFFRCKTTCCFTTNDVLFYHKRRVVLLQTTCCFTTNDVMFYPKRHDVLPKTTCYFATNDVLFYHKQRVVSLKMNMCFWGCCDTCDSKKQKSCRMRVRYARVYVCVARGDD